MKSIGKYHVIEELGGSATGKTYRAKDSFRNREFAVKVLVPLPGVGTEAREQLCAHLAKCAELTHRHIAKVQDLGEIDEGIFIATEWGSGMDLRTFMRENRELPLGEKLALIAQVSEGLAFAHSRGIAHGNLKPSNILVDGARDVRILDFGSAKWLAALLESGSRPEGLVANYLAPEQVLGQPFDGRSDIFALGLMLYEFAAGKYPFPAGSDLIAREIVHGEPEPLGQLDVQAPAELEQLLARALQKDPEQRWQTAEEFASELYVAAQRVRRMAAIVATSAAPAEPIEDKLIESQVPPAPVEPAAAPRIPPPEPSTRQRLQDSEPPPQPWTARSYANAPPLATEGPNCSLANPGSSHVPAPAPGPQAAPLVRPPAVRPTPRPPMVTRPLGNPMTGMSKRHVAVAAAGLVLAAGIAAWMVSRQALRASQVGSHAATPITAPAAPSAQAPSLLTPALQPRIPIPEQPRPSDIRKPEFSAKQISNPPWRSLWEAGRYAEALALINQTLAKDPTDNSALSWKKKIREAQAAEAALK